MSYGSSECTPCSAGSYSSNGTECVACEAGYFSANINSTMCVACSNGKYSGIGSLSCTACTSGVSYSNHTGCQNTSDSSRTIQISILFTFIIMMIAAFLSFSF